VLTISIVLSVIYYTTKQYKVADATDLSPTFSQSLDKRG